MKKFFLTVAAMLTVFGMSARVFEASEPRALDGLQGSNIGLSADGSAMVLVTADGIARVDVATGESKVVVPGTNFYQLSMDADANNVVYVQSVFKNKMRYSTLNSADLATGKTTQIVKPSRNLNSGFAVSGETVNAVNNGKRVQKRLDGSKAVAAPVASINYGHLDITDVNGNTVSIDPQGRGSYLWPSVSPDGTRVLYWMVGAGCFTCNLDGSDVKSLGALRAAVWAGNDAVIGMDEREGQNQVVTESYIVAADLATGERQYLTDNSLVAGFPVVSKDGSTLSFTDNNDNVYIMNLKK